MPNWCNCTMTVEGEPEKVAEFVSQMKGVDEDGAVVALDFEAVMPMPRVLSGRTSPSEGIINWYDWQVANWGVKWGACRSDVSQSNGDRVAFYTFDTPWGPAVNWQERVIEYYPWLSFSFTWEEWGMMFAGEQHGDKGIASDVEERELTEEEWKEQFPDEESW